MQKYLQNYSPMAGVYVNGKMETLAFDTIQITKNAIIAFIKANGQVPVLMTQPLGRPSVDQDSFNDAIRSVAKAQSVGLVDLAKELKTLSSGSSLFYDDNIHFNNSFAIHIL